MKSALAEKTFKAENKHKPASEESKLPNFITYIWRTPLNRKYLLAALGINLIMFLVYKYCYPLPDFSSDAQGYIHAAAGNEKSFYRPFGYSAFLQFIHHFSSSHYFTVAVQYFLLTASALFSFFSVDYLYPFRNPRLKSLSWLFTAANPCLLILSNLMLADALFVAFSAAWFTLFLWIMKRKHWWCLLLQLVFLYWSFQVRYNGLYYPVIAGVVFLFFPGMKMHYRITGMLASFLLIFNAYTTIKRTNHRNTGANVFAGFSGWQMANNALLIYKKTDTKPQDFEDPDLKIFDQVVKYFIDSVALDAARVNRGVPSAAFLWDKNSPLKRYTFYYAARHKMAYLPAWYQVSTLYQEYGWHIIKENPGVFFKHYLLPNFYEYVIPSMEIMGQYDLGKTGLAAETRAWLKIKDANLSATVPGIQERIMYPYPWLHALLLAFGMITPVLFTWKCYKHHQRWKMDFLMPVLLWYLFVLADMAFSCFASIVVFRYVALLFIIGYGLPFHFLDRFIYKDKKQGYNRSRLRKHL